MIRLLHLAFLLTTLVSQAQQASYLEPDNPAPRLGTSIDISVHLQKEDLRWLEQKENLTSDEQEALDGNIIGGGMLKITQVMQDTGSVTIGPFTFVIGNAIYNTDAIDVKVLPPLPVNATDGLWVRVENFRGFYYRLIEQRVANSWKRDSKDANTLTLSTSELKFSEFNRDRLEQQGLEILSSSESTENQELNNESHQAQRMQVISYGSSS